MIIPDKEADLFTEKKKKMLSIISFDNWVGSLCLKKYILESP